MYDMHWRPRVGMHAVMGAACKALPNIEYTDALGLQPRTGLQQPACSGHPMTNSYNCAVDPACTLDGSSTALSGSMQMFLAGSLAQDRHAACVSHCSQPL